MTERSALNDAIVQSWTDNAESWTEIVREGLIPSRKAGTDAAIVAACLSRAGPALDVGCGEGWLVRRLEEAGLRAEGVDVSAQLVARASELGGTFTEGSYEQLITDASLLPGPWQQIICNFALLGDPLAPLLRAMRDRLAPGGVLLIQTLHPWAARGDAPYRSGWRTESFSSCSVSFPTPMPWYYRTLGAWIAELRAAGLQVLAIDEPTSAESGAPLSLLLTCGVP